MNDDIKRTYVSIDEEAEQRNRKDFTPVEKYAAMMPEKNEIGSIVEFQNGPTYSATEIVGLYAISGGVCKERIFLKEEA